MEISEQFYRTAVENMMSGFALHSIITDDKGNPTDYRYIEVNKAFEEFTGLKRENVIGKSICEIVPAIEKDTMDWIHFFGKVALTGDAGSAVQYSQAFDRWYNVNAFCPEVGYFVAIFVDITSFKKQEDNLGKRSEALRVLYEEQKLLYKELFLNNEKLQTAQKEVLLNERRLQKAQVIAKVGNWEVDLDTKVLWASEEAFRMYGVERKSPLLNLSDVRNIPLKEYRYLLDEAYDKLVTQNIPYDIKYEIQTGDGVRKHIHSLAEIEKDEKGKPFRLIGVIQDITKDVAHEMELNKKNEELSALYEEILASEEELRQQNDVLYQKNEEISALYEEVTAQEEELRANYGMLAESTERLKKSETINGLIIDATSEGVWQYDIAENIYTISRGFVEALGYSVEEMNTIKKVIDITHPDDKERVLNEFNKYRFGHTPKYESEYRLICKDGSYIWVKSSGKILKNLKGEAYLMAGSFIDITRMREQQKKLEYMAYHDLLTDLPNGALFLMELEKAMVRAERKNKMLAVIFFDLDNFKDVNDTLGHNTGDRLLKELANRLLEQIRKQDILTRLGGDEFVLLIQDLDTKEEVYEFCARIKEKILEPFEFGGYRFNISSSIGIALYPSDVKTNEELLKNADTAMYQAKNAGKNNIQFYHEGMRMNMLRRLTVENRLRTALKNKEFTLHYQPQICLKTGKIRAFEALIRWTDEELGIVSPAEFIPIAESAGLIVNLGEWILYEACRQAKDLNTNGSGIMISVNISAVQLKQTNFVDMVKRTLEKTGLPAEYLELEVTETTMISSFDTTIPMLEELRKLGIKISLDDFGTGYSSLSYLKKLPIDTLKIDKSFINDLDSEYVEEEITEAIVSLVHRLNIEVVAEGVETGKQLAYLMQCKCDNIQGFLLSRPVPACDVPEVISKNFTTYIGMQY